ncbi:MAG TPA: hypothetical protein VF635_16540 [Propionibacteriaceae bacterium]
MTVNAAFPLIRERHVSLTREALRGIFRDQRDVVLAGRSLGDEWDALLERAIFTRSRNTVADIGGQVARKFRAEFDPDVLQEWLTAIAGNAAVSINGSTRDALDGSDDHVSVFEALVAGGVARYAQTIVTTAANKGAREAAERSGGRTKTWVSSGGPRHSGMNGQTVDIRSAFSNGMDVPGDPDGGADDVANCRCSVTFD